MKTEKDIQAGERTQSHKWEAPDHGFLCAICGDSLDQHEANRRTQHTPGPWSKADNGAGIVKVFGRDLVVVSDVAILRDGMNNAARDEEMSANARLIAAAPELLEACVELVRLHETMGNDLPGVRSARAAIAKAEGRQS